jgi:CHAT domain-containing protein/tetratricopeptide (TPR) repeat protein
MGVSLVLLLLLMAFVLKGTVSAQTRENQSDQCEALFSAGVEAYYEYRYSDTSTNAIEHFQEAQICFNQLGDPQGEVDSFNNIGEVYIDQRRYSMAIQNYEKALTIAQEINNEKSKTILLFNIGEAYFLQERYTKALNAFEQSLITGRSLEEPDKAIEIDTIQYMSFCYEHQGNYEEALRLLKEALELGRQSIDNRMEEGVKIHNIAVLYERLGRYGEALLEYERALLIRQESNDLIGEAATLNNIGGVYQAQGRNEKALVYYERALNLLLSNNTYQEYEIHDVNFWKGVILVNIGNTYHSQQRYDEALEHYEEALNVLIIVNDKTGEGLLRNNIGVLLENRGEPQKALKWLEQALDLRQQLGDIVGEGYTRYNIGVSLTNLGRDNEALTYYTEALDIFANTSDRLGQGVVLGRLGEVYDVRGESTQALEYYEQSLMMIESVRVVAGSEQARASFIKQYAGVYERILEIYYYQQQNYKAFHTSENGRARAFLDSLATDQVQLADNDATELLEREQALYGERQANQDALARAHAADPLDADLIADLEAQLAQLESDYAAVQSEIAGRSAALTALVPGRSAVPETSEIQTALDTDTTLLAYWVTDEQTFAFVVTRDALEVVELNVTRNQLLSQVRALRSFANVSEAHPVAATALYAELIVPLEEHLTTPHLAIIPHDVLHYLPFAALSDGERFLVDDYTLTLLPSASSLLHIQQNSGNALANPLVLGNPATDNPDLQSLRFAEDEARTIAGMFDSTPFLGNTATEAAVRAGSTGAGILHIAAHGTFNQAAPLESALFLAPAGADDGQLTVREIYSLNLQQADLVVLSACETQIDDTGIVHGQLSVDAGDELVGLTRAFFYAGTPSVVSTLWSVDDAPSAMLMERFYTHLYNGLGKAAALRQAQMDVREQYPNPYYWAGYVLSGDAGRSGNQGATPGHPNAHDSHTAAPGNGVGAHVQRLLPWFLACLGIPLVLVVVIAGLMLRRRVARS